MKQSKSDAARGRAAHRFSAATSKSLESVSAGRHARRKGAGSDGIALMASVEEPEHPYVSVEKLLGLYKPRKRKVTVRLDADVLEWFRKDGEGYQTRINRALRRVMRLEMKEGE